MAGIAAALLVFRKVHVVAAGTGFIFYVLLYVVIMGKDNAEPVMIPIYKQGITTTGLFRHNIHDALAPDVFVGDDGESD